MRPIRCIFGVHSYKRLHQAQVAILEPIELPITGDIVPVGAMAAMFIDACSRCGRERGWFKWRHGKAAGAAVPVPVDWVRGLLGPGLSRQR